MIADFLFFKIQGDVEEVIKYLHITIYHSLSLKNRTENFEEINDINETNIT